MLNLSTQHEDNVQLLDDPDFAFRPSFRLPDTRIVFCGTSYDQGFLKLVVYGKNIV